MYISLQKKILFSHFRLLGNFLEAAKDLRLACKIDFDDQADEWLREVTPNVSVFYLLHDISRCVLFFTKKYHLGPDFGAGVASFGVFAFLPAFLASVATPWRFLLYWVRSSGSS